MASLIPGVEPLLNAAMSPVGQRGAAAAAGAAGVLGIQYVCEQTTDWVKSYKEMDKTKLTRLNDLSIQFFSQQLTMFRNISYSVESYRIETSSTWELLLIREELSTICDIQKKCKYLYGNESNPPPENMFLEEMKQWMIRFTQKENLNDDTKIEIEKRIEYINRAANQDDIHLNDHFVTFLKTDLFSILRALNKTATNEIKRNKLRSILNKINTIGLEIIQKSLRLIYDIRGLNDLNVTNITPDLFLKAHKTLERNSWGQLILSIVTAPTLQSFIPPKDSYEISFDAEKLQQKQKNFHDQILSILDFFLLCRTYKDYREIGGNLLLKNQIKQITVNEDIEFVFNNVLEINKEICTEAKNRSEESKVRRCRFPRVIGDKNKFFRYRCEWKTKEEVQSSNINIAIHALETRLNHCLEHLNEMSTEAIKDNNEMKLLAQDGKNILQYATNLHKKVEAIRKKSMQNKNEEETKGKRDQRKAPKRSAHQACSNESAPPPKKRKKDPGTSK